MPACAQSEDRGLTLCTIRHERALLPPGPSDAHRAIRSAPAIPRAIRSRSAQDCARALASACSLAVAALLPAAAPVTGTGAVVAVARAVSLPAAAVDRVVVLAVVGVGASEGVQLQLVLCEVCPQLRWRGATRVRDQGLPNTSRILL